MKGRVQELYWASVMHYIDTLWICVQKGFNVLLAGSHYIQQGEVIIGSRREHEMVANEASTLTLSHASQDWL